MRIKIKKPPVVINANVSDAEARDQIAAYLNRVPDPISVKDPARKKLHHGGPAAQFKYNPAW